MKDVKNKNSRLENDSNTDDEYSYIRHAKKDNFKLDDLDTEHYYCKYCKKKDEKALYAKA